MRWTILETLDLNGTKLRAGLELNSAYSIKGRQYTIAVLVSLGSEYPIGGTFDTGLESACW